jgi:hypothetical protein
MLIKLLPRRRDNSLPGRRGRLYRFYVRVFGKGRKTQACVQSDPERLEGRSSRADKSLCFF